MAIFLNFVVKTALIWLVLGGFVCVFSKSETMHSFLSQSELSNFFRVYYCCKSWESLWRRRCWGIQELIKKQWLVTWKVDTTFGNSSLQKLERKWVQAFGAVISGIVWEDKRYLWLVHGCFEYHRPFITNACQTKQKSLHPELVPTLLYRIFENAKTIRRHAVCFER